MVDRPISFLEPELRLIRERGVMQIRRPGELLGRCKKDERLWIREPFHFTRALDGFAPTSALRLGAGVAAFAVDGLGADIGRRRYAREMPRAVHRYHLRVLSCLRQRLQAISEADCIALGFPHRDAFASHWDEQHGTATISGGRTGWKDNPFVTVLAVEFHDRPLRAPASKTPKES